MKASWLIKLIPILLVLLMATSVVNAATDVVGKTVAVVGSVLAQHKGEDRQHPLQVKQPVFLYDVIESGVGSRAKFMMKDDSILKLGPNSEIILDELLVGADQQKSTIKQLKGHLRILLGKKLKPKSHFRIQTPVAVAGVRGTDFEVIVLPGKTAVRCFEGRVEVKNILDTIPGQVILIPNVYTIVEEGKPPTPPVAIPAGQPLQSVLGAKAKQAKSDQEEKESGTVAESPETEDTTEGGHSDPESESGDSSVIAGGASSGSGSGGGSSASGSSTTVTGITLDSTSAGSSSDATTSSAGGDSSSTGSATGGGALVGDTSGSTAPGSSTLVSTLPTSDTLFNSLGVQEVQNVSSNNFSESSASGQVVLQNLGIVSTDSAGTTNDASANTFITDLTIDTVMDSVVEQSLGIGPEDTVPDPITNNGSIVFDINFPTP